MDIKYKIRTVLTGVALAVYAGVPALADDIEIYTSGALGAPVIQPNVMFIVDTSGSMGQTIDIQVDYDYTTVYGGNYSSTQIYYSTDGESPKSNSSSRFNKTANKCDASLQQYDKGVVIDPIGPLERDGFYSDQIAQYDTANDQWRTTKTSRNADRSYPIECKADSGIHGETSAVKPYIENNATGWTSTVPADPGNPHPVWNAGANQLWLFDGNYLNYLDSGGATQSVSRMQIAKDAVKSIVDNNNNINICLMRFDGAWNYEGGPVIYPCEDVKASRNDFNSRLKNLTDGGSTPLSETYYEALLYFGGKEIDYGNSSNPSNQTGTKESGNPSNYDTPITDTCQKNYIVYVTDGAPQLDYLSTARRTGLAGTFPVNTCNTDPDPGLDDLNHSSYNKDAYLSATSSRDNCLDELAGWALNNDVAERVFAAHTGKQTISTYTIGFDFDNTNPDLQAAERLLRDTATAGGGSFYEAKSKDSLLNAFNSIVAEILAVNSTFSSPAVSVNAFNRATNLDDLYFTLFKPTGTEHWEGNFKKFKLLFDAATGDPFIADQNDKPAVDPATGFFTKESKSYWTAGAADGAETALGGAASMLTNVRNVYTMAGTYANASGVLTPSEADLTDVTNGLDKSNALITEVMLDTVGVLPIVGATPYRESLLDWAAGIDVLDENGDDDATDARKVMGDPLHAEPALVQYGKIGDEPDLVAYVATNDGYLHAINSIDGTEYFAFVPQEMLPRLKYVFEDTGVTGKAYGLDGNIVAWINDDNNDGAISGAADHVYLYVGMRRGGRNIYSMDVTARNSPKLRWVIEGGAGDYAELGETWSTVNVEKLNMGGTQKTVLIFGGGYDTSQDVSSTRNTDSQGRGIFIVDADDGSLIWRAGLTGSGADLELDDMKYSIPARIKPIDVDGDGNVDRLYAADMGGQIWRVDIDNDSNGANTVAATGGRIADLADDADVTAARRFYYPPDVAVIVQEGQAPYVSIVAGSGYRAHPLNKDIHDRMYMIRDYDVYNTPADYTTVTEADLFDTTDNIIGEGDQVKINSATTTLNSKKGWYISLNEPDGSWIGEKNLSEPLILNGVAIMTTFIPEAVGAATNACKPNDGTGSIYYVNVVDGTPTYDLSGKDGKKRDDRKVFLERGGIPPSPTIIITEEGTPTLCVGTECEKAKGMMGIQKLYWYEVEQ